MTEMQNLPTNPQILDRPRRVFKLADRLCALSICLLAVLFVHSGLKDRGLLLWISLTLLLIGTPFYLKRFGVCFTARTAVLYSLLPLFALPRLLFDASAVHGAALLVVSFGYMYAVHYIAAGYGSERLPGEFFLLDAGKALFGMPFSSYGAGPEAILTAKKKGLGRLVGAWILGLCAAIIPTFVVLALLIGADNHFESFFFDLVERLFTLDLSLIAVALPVGIMLGFYVFGHLWACGNHELGGGVKQENALRIASVCRFAPTAMVCAAVLPLLLLYLLFVISQLPYFIGGFTGALPDGLTYADYARKGFFELCSVAVINAAVLACIALFTRRNADKPPLAARILSILLSAFTLMLLASAMAKMLLYVDTYGLSRKRIYVLWLMCFLALFFLVQLAGGIFRRLRVSAAVFALAVLFLGVFLFADFDRIIADYNVDAYLSGEMEAVDVDMLRDLSASAVPSLLRLYDETEHANVRRDAGGAIRRFLLRTQGAAMEAYGYSGWSFNLAQARALKLVRAHAGYPYDFFAQ
ncbi:MAG: DUF4173 domain-containing protein [Clostridia bacterium]|nr:DUF4173 domain-containing protein [Clostridia bacterium]